MEKKTSTLFSFPLLALILFSFPGCVDRQDFPALTEVGDVVAPDATDASPGATGDATLKDDAFEDETSVFCEGVACDDVCCGTDGLCFDGACCVPQCDGLECGDDGCGGSCGTCPEVAPICDHGTCALTCSPDCQDLACGPDGCEGSCGSCHCGETCDDGHCVFHACDGRECGDDGCGGSCGVCDEDGNPCTDVLCNQGLCVPVPNALQCDDGDPCTTGDHCTGGACAAQPVLCSDHGKCQGDGSCLCTAGYKGTACDACVVGYGGYPNCQPEDLVLWNTLGSDSELLHSVVGPALIPEQDLSFQATTDGGGIYYASDLYPDHNRLAWIPTEVLDTDRGTACMEIEILSFPEIIPSDFRYYFLIPHGGTHCPSITINTNDGMGHGGWVAHCFGARIFSGTIFQDYDLSALGMDGEHLHLCIVWDKDGVPGAEQGQKVAFYVNASEHGTYIETEDIPWADTVDWDLSTDGEHGSSYVHPWEDPLQVELIHDDLKIYSTSLTAQEIAEVRDYECCIPQCVNKACGPDGCGGSCGGCPSAYSCVTLKIVLTGEESSLCVPLFYEFPSP